MSCHIVRAIVGLALATVAACSAPAVGTWSGTADLGPQRGQQLRLQLFEDEKTGKLWLQDPGKPEDFSVCSLQRTGRSVQIEYDAARPNCAGDAGSPSERRVLKGTIGEGVVFGEVWQGGEKLGFFRAFAPWITDDGQAKTP